MSLAKNVKKTASISPVLLSCSDSRSDGSRSYTQSVISYRCDIGKLLEENVDIKTLTEEQLYQILAHKPNPNTFVYPHTRVSPSNSPTVSTKLVKGASLTSLVHSQMVHFVVHV